MHVAYPTGARPRHDLVGTGRDPIRGRHLKSRSWKFETPLVLQFRGPVEDHDQGCGRSALDGDIDQETPVGSHVVAAGVLPSLEKPPDWNLEEATGGRKRQASGRCGRTTSGDSRKAPTPDKRAHRLARSRNWVAHRACRSTCCSGFLPPPFALPRETGGLQDRKVGRREAVAVRRGDGRRERTRRSTRRRESERGRLSPSVKRGSRRGPGARPPPGHRGKTFIPRDPAASASLRS
jgi:hypothetical protein